MKSKSGHMPGVGNLMRQPTGFDGGPTPDGVGPAMKQSGTHKTYEPTARTSLKTLMKQ